MEAARKTSIALAHCHVGRYGRGDYAPTLDHPREYDGELVTMFRHGREVRAREEPVLREINLSMLREGTRRHERWSARGHLGFTVAQLRARGLPPREIEYLSGRGVIVFDPPMRGEG